MASESETGTSCEESTSNLLEGGKNKNKLYCERCSSLILLQNKAMLLEKEFDLPHMKKKSESSQPGDAETLRDFWIVDDMFTFENVGFSNTVGNIKFLTCADCEIGPIGWHDLSDKKAFYIALSRVKYG